MAWVLTPLSWSASIEIIPGARYTKIGHPVHGGNSKSDGVAFNDFYKEGIVRSLAATSQDLSALAVETEHSVSPAFAPEAFGGTNSLTVIILHADKAASCIKHGAGGWYPPVKNALKL